VDVQKLARSHTPEAIEALVRGLKDPKHYVAAASALLDRGWGKPTVVLAGDTERPIAIDFTWAPALPAASNGAAGNVSSEIASSVTKAAVIDAVLADDNASSAAPLVLEWADSEVVEAEANSDGVVVRLRKD
jgi:hypothetical protein